MESAAIGILALSGIAAVAAMVAFAFGRHVVSALDSAFSKWRQLGFVGRIVTAAMVVVATVEAQKKCSNVKDSISSFKHSNIQTFKHYFSLEQVITNDSYSYAMPASAVRYPNWWLRGGYEDVFKLELGDWRFPIGTNLVDYLWVYTWGKVRPGFKAKELEIVAVGSPMSAVPQVSEFWYADGTNGSKILTWHNFFVGRIPLSESNGSQSNCLTQSPQSSLSSPLCVSAQLELFVNGDYIARSNNVERYYKRVNPDDWDDDGIPNIVDANPEGNDGDFFGPDNDLPEGANSSNYCWVEVAVSNANSLVTFTGDKPSNLPDPYFVAKAGESYAVNLLIGKTYRVTSSQPITCTAKSSDDIIINQDDERSMTIVYPVSYEIVDNARSVSRQVRLTPPLVGMYTWNTNTCCETEKRDGPYLPSCAPDCTCEGGCDTGGFTFSYEGYSLDFGGVACGCMPNEEDDDEMDPASVEVSFSKRAIIYEEAYETAPGVTVPRRSTGSVLTCRASGGPKGGMVEFTLSDGNRLAKSGGSFPYTKELAPGEEVSFEITCTGQGESGGEDDIVVTGTFTENEIGETLAAEDRLTVVRVDFMPVLEAPANTCLRRHKVGVREVISYACQPNLQDVEWRNVGNGHFSSSEEYICSLDADENPIVVCYKNVEYTPLITVVTPNGIEARDVNYWKGNVPTNCAGGIGLKMKLYVKPLDVSFAEIAVEEVPCAEGTHSGYFSLPQFSGEWYHSRENGAGKWHNIGEGNLFGDDIACISNELNRINDSGLFVTDEKYGWRDGLLVWQVPFGWNEKGTSGTAQEFKRFAEDVQQEMIIFSWGLSGVRKFSNMATREIDGRIFLNGVQKK